MKRLFIGVFVFSLLANSFSQLSNVYAMDQNSDMNTTPDTLNSSQTIEVSDFDGLRVAVAKSDITIHIKNDIQLLDTIHVTGRNVIIQGEGNTLDLYETDVNNKKNKFVIKGNNVEIHNLTLENYMSNGISVYRAQNVVLNNIVLSGNEKTLPTNQQSNVGVDLDGSSATLIDIQSRNHRYSGIRLRNTSNVDLQGNHIHQEDKEDLESVNVNGQVENSIQDSNQLYTLTGEKDDTVNNRKSLYYNMKKRIDVDTFESLKNALMIQNSIITLTNDIVFTENIDITKPHIVVNGNGHYISMNNTHKLVVKANNTTINNLEVKDYEATGLSIYKVNGIAIRNVKFIGNDKNLSTDRQSTVGVDLDHSNVVVQNITSKNHRYSGIRLRNESSITLEGGNLHIDDTQDLESVTVQGANDNTIEDITSQYNLTEEKDDLVNGRKTAYYNTKKAIEVDSFEKLQQAILIQNSIISVVADITFHDDIDITNKHITINGNGNTFDLNGQYKFSVKADYSTVLDLNIENYISTGLTVYRARGVHLSNVTLIGKHIDLSNEERSKVGIDIFESTVELGNITSKSHLYRGIQVRSGSIVKIVTKNQHENDTIHMQSIVAENDVDNQIIDDSNFYLKGVEKEEEGIISTNYFSKIDVDITSVQEFIHNLQNSGNVLHIKNDIRVEQTDLPVGVDIFEFVVSSNIIVQGNGNTIDLNNLGTITIKGDSTKFEDLTILNANTMGVNIYNSIGVALNNIRVEHSSRYGIFVNGSEVKLKDSFTKNNIEGGIMITRSRTLNNKGNRDSYVEVIDSIDQRESNIAVGVHNLEMIDGTFQNNQFVAPDGFYDRYENDVEYKVLSDYYLDYFGIVGENRNKKYKEQKIDYMIIKTPINAQTNTEVIDSDGSYVRLAGDGITDDTENLEKLIYYAATNSKEIYFPSGVYKITRDINMDNMGLLALSHFSLVGDQNGLSILDASSIDDRMLKIQNAEYKSYMNYVNIKNMVFNNVGLEFNGPYKKGISLNDNIFLNGKYTREKNASGDISKVTMVPYVTVKNSKYMIERNSFLRGDKYPGRGISTYRTKNTTIQDNFFGRLEGIKDAERMLPADVIAKLQMMEQFSNTYAADDLKAVGSQGNFFTAINNERYDENTVITNNYFDLDKTRNIISDFPENVLISGINVNKEGQRRDHIIYAKGYDGLYIYGNFFKGQENGAAGGVKIRNGKNAYIGSNNFHDVPLLTYIYSDLSRDESLLYNTTIYHNLFHQSTNFGLEGTGILYYQSFRDGDDLEFKVTNADGSIGTSTWKDAFGDVQNFVMYNNTFLSDDRDQITISNRAVKAFHDNQFIASGNKYYEYDIRVNYHVGNLIVEEAAESVALSKVNDGYQKYKDTLIPLTPAPIVYQYLMEELQKADDFYNEISQNGLIGVLGGQYNEEVANEMDQLLKEIKALLATNSLNQWHTNKHLTLVQETLEKLKASINDKGLAPEIFGIDQVNMKVGSVFEPWEGVTILDDRDSFEQIEKNVEIGDFNNQVAGSYTITYTAKDRDGNVTSANRVVIVESVESVSDTEEVKENMDNSNVEEMGNSVNTGDQSRFALWLFVLCVSGLFIVLVGQIQKKRR